MGLSRHKSALALQGIGPWAEHFGRGHVGERGIATRSSPSTGAQMCAARIILFTATKEGAKCRKCNVPAPLRLVEWAARSCEGRQPGSPEVGGRPHPFPQCSTYFSAETGRFPKALTWAAECCGVGRDRVNEGKREGKGEWKENTTQITTPLHYTSQGLRLFGHGVSLITY